MGCNRVEGHLAAVIRELQHVARVLAAAHCLPATDGNFSARLDATRVVLTRKAIEKRELRQDDFVVSGVDDPAPEGGSSEWRLHQTLYRARPEIACVLHAHAPGLTAFAVARRVPDASLLAESALLLGRVALVPFVSPGTAALGETLIATDRDAGVYILANHGSVTVGGTITEALHRMERAEFLAVAEIQATILGRTMPLTETQLAELRTASPGPGSAKASPPS
ncbi:class II aldolase/adducin family protein [candidate division KSB1 bacterium]|nr:class II aldolase/adducin family protein [candidate division KSB1 bacterium]